MLNNLTSKINAIRPIPRPVPGGPPKPLPKPAPGRQDDCIAGPGGRPKPAPGQRMPQPGDIYIGGPGPKGQKQYDAKDLEKFGAKLENIRPGGPYKLPDGAAIVKKLLGQ